MLNRLSRLFAPKPDSADTAVPPSTPDPEKVAQHLDPGAPYAHGEPVPRWPELGAALVVATPDALLDTQKETIQRIRGFSPLLPSQFEELIVPVFRRYAEWVHLLPASEYQHHSGPGGLLAHGFEVALHAARIADGKQVGTDLTPSARAAFQPRWKVATMLGGLFHDLGKPLVDCGATDPDRKITWSAHSGSLYSWLVENKLTHYRFYWRSGPRHERHKPVGTSVIREIMGKEILDWLCDEPTQDVVNMLMMSIAQGKVASNLMSIVVSTADSLSTEADLKRLAQRTAGSGQGGANHLGALVVNEMRKLMETNQLTFNQAGGQVWITEDAVFGVVPALIEAVKPRLAAKQIAGLPANYLDYLQLLVETGFIEQAVEETKEQRKTSNVWDLYVEGTGREALLKDVALKVIRFRQPEFLLGNLPMPTPVSATVRAPFVTEEDKAALAASVVYDPTPQSEEAALAPPPNAMQAPAADTDRPAPVPAATHPPSTANTSSSADGQEAGSEEGPHIESRRDRRDSAFSREDQRRRELQQAPEAKGNTWEQEKAKLEKIGLIGASVVGMLCRIGDRKIVWMKDAFETSDGLVVRYPEGLQSLGIPETEILKSAFDHKCLVTDQGSERKVTERDFPGGGREKCVIFNGPVLAAWRVIKANHPEILDGQMVNLRGDDDTVMQTPQAESRPAQPRPADGRRQEAREAGNRHAPQQKPQAAPGPNGGGASRNPQAEGGQGRPKQGAPGGNAIANRGQGQPPQRHAQRNDRPVAGAAPAAHREQRPANRENLMDAGSPKPVQVNAPSTTAPQRPASSEGDRNGYSNKANGQGGNALAAAKIDDLTPEKIEKINGYCWLVIQREYREQGGKMPEPIAMRDILFNFASRMKVRNAPMITALSVSENPAFIFKRSESFNPNDISDLRVNADYAPPAWVDLKYQTLPPVKEVTA